MEADLNQTAFIFSSELQNTRKWSKVPNLPMWGKNSSSGTLHTYILQTNMTRSAYFRKIHQSRGHNIDSKVNPCIELVHCITQVQPTHCLLLFKGVDERRSLNISVSYYTALSFICQLSLGSDFRRVRQCSSLPSPSSSSYPLAPLESCSAPMMHSAHPDRF